MLAEAPADETTDLLHLEAVRSPASSSLLELSALGDSSGLNAVVGVRIVGRGAVAEVTNRVTGVLSTTQQHSVGTLGSAQGQLIQSDALTTSLDDSGSGSLGESQSSNGQLRDLQQALIISDGTNNNSGLAILAIHVSGKSGDGNRRVINSGHSQSLDNGGSELGLSTSGQETEDNNHQPSLHTFHYKQTCKASQAT